MATLSALRDMVSALPAKGTRGHDQLTSAIHISKHAAEFCMDDDGYWGEKGRLLTCESQWVHKPDGWQRDKNKKGKKTFLGLTPVRCRKRVTVIASTQQVVGMTAEQYAAAGWFARDYNGHTFWCKDEMWCHEALTEGAFRCSQTGAWYCHLGAQFTDTQINGQSYCHEDATLYYWNDRWQLTPQPERSERPTPELDPNRVPEYHSDKNSRAAWKKSLTKDVVYGCELEIFCNINRMDVVKMAKELKLVAERDGSIDQTSGIEIIGPPGTLQWHSDADGPWMKFLSLMTERVDGKEPRAKGWDAGVGYGMHVSLNRLGIKTATQAKMIKFVNDNVTLCTQIAGRENNERMAAYKIKDLQDIEYDLGRNNSEKYEALAIRDESRLEMRIFRSTLDKAGFLRNVEFCAALVDFCGNHDVKEMKHANFLDWLKGESEYPNLRKKLILTKKRKVSS